MLFTDLSSQRIVRALERAGFFALKSIGKKTRWHERRQEEGYYSETQSGEPLYAEEHHPRCGINR
ncbi:MAG: hypothetical protein A3D65_00395 [Candidatus Lloydbacteria bacterium RIFCSPHIGHO2_02_FULL_50_13]|uniref:Uncharacterized protein n=1 Tax=Candidatus Lloydbacteria bacterium RIFCSPHIGHO2_02_FULL_50_13 TaxID=1798661 RepID=A0A1G2D3W5_9BACT|nr:MAG: hypothetical protein A3D65_00395 [Candidatus Lloydbacteria bacterium RIFCSPHIGHO2_02_FULL_50_13]